MKRLVKILVPILILAMMLSACSSTDSSSANTAPETNTAAEAAPAEQAVEKITLRVGMDVAPVDYAAQFTQYWVDLVAEKSEGAIEIVPYYSSQLGSVREMIEMCQTNNLDFTVSTPDILTNFVPDYAALSLPYLFSGYEHADNVFLGEIGDELLTWVEDAGLYGVAIFEGGFRELTNSKMPVNSLADVEGLRIRVMESPAHIELWTTLGADAVPMSWGDAYTALQQKAIDGQENSVTVIIGNAVEEVNEYMAMTDHLYTSLFLVSSGETWNNLTAEQQQLIKECAEEAEVWGRENRRTAEADLIKQLEEGGMTITYPDKQEFIDATSDIRAGNTEYADLLGRIEAAG